VVNLDGAPVADAEVVIEPFDPTQKLGSETVRTDASGKFAILPHSKKAPLSPGKYVILVSKWVRKDGTVPPPPDAMMEKMSGTLKNALPFAYSAKGQGAKFTVEVKPGTNDVGTLDLKSK